MKKKCRDQFEEWISLRCDAKLVERFPDDATNFAWPGCYKSLTVQLAWKSWAEGWERAKLTDALNYEIYSSWWVGWVGIPCLQRLTSTYFVWKVTRKWRRYEKRVAQL